jgi:SRSO17 transposase
MKTMDHVEFVRVATAFRAFHREFAPLFGRIEAQQRSEQYLRGLLVQQTDRRNAENIAEAVAGATPRTLQRLLPEAPWDTAPVITALQAYLASRLSTPAGVFVLDATGFPKKGTRSVGVARQYAGTLGKVGNCQLGVFLAYVSDRGHALVDTRLYLPREWTDDPARCRAAGVPAAVGYQSQADLGLVMLRQARAAGHLRGRWVTADEDYGKVPTFRDALDADGWWYVLEVPTITTVFTEPAATTVPTWSGRGRKPTRARLVDPARRPQAVQAVAAAWPADRWQALTVAEGAQGPRRYQFAAQRVWESRDGLPGRPCWLVLRRNRAGSDRKCYLSNAPADTPLRTLGRVGAMRWPIETEFQTGKGETGLDEYEVRSWPGWHHHITLALLAGAFLLTIQQDWGGKSARPDAATSQPRAPRVAAPPHVDARRAARLAERHPTAQRPRQTFAHQTSPRQVA